MPSSRFQSNSISNYYYTHLHTPKPRVTTGLCHLSYNVFKGNLEWGCLFGEAALAQEGVGGGTVAAEGFKKNHGVL